MIAALIFLTGCIEKKTDQTTDSNVIIQSRHKKNSESHEIKELVNNIYGRNGANLELDQIFIIEDLIISILHTSEMEQQQVALAAAHMLQDTLDEYSKDQQCIRTYLIHYLQDFSNHIHEKNFSSNILKIAKKIIKYINIEQDNIFTNPKSKHIFIAAIKAHKLPTLINFWQTTSGNKILKNYDPTNQIQTQFIEMLADMGVMMGTQMGASMANQEIGVQRQLLASIINKNSQTVQTDMQAFQNQAQKNQQQQMQAMVSAFSKAQTNLQTQMQQASSISNLELNYLYQNISTAQPQQNYIFSQIQFDQYFSLGTMYTPAGPLWKNPFSVGDWEYEPATNSFWQYQSSPIANSTTDSSGNTTTSTLQAENNAIYAEYFINSGSYTIAGTISLNIVNYPFFAGIIFNKARWISGDFEAIRKCRMVGIYGISPTNIGIYFAQQYTMTDAQLTASGSQSPIQTPLQQIINNQVKPSIPVLSSTLASLPNTPVTFNFTITNSPNSVTFNFWTGNNKPSSVTINNLDPAIYMYHGIGFICPGAIAEFNLTQPSDFIFTPQAISNYKD